MSSIACARHPADALGACARCGTFVCGECGERFESLLACRGCVQRLGLPLTLTGQLVIGLIFALPTLAVLALKLRAGSDALVLLAGVPVVGILFLFREVLHARHRATSHLGDVLLAAAITLAVIESLAALIAYLSL